MRALQLEDFGKLVVTELPEPDPGPGEVVLDVIATGICGSDIHGFTGENGRRVPGQVMGHESVGRVRSLGHGIDATLAPIGHLATFNPVIVSALGQRVFAGREQHDPGRTVIGVSTERTSAFAQRIVVPIENVVLLPEDIPVVYGALIEPLAVGLNAVRRVQLRPGESVLVVGGGPIGQSTVLAAVHEGAAHVYVSEPNVERRALCESIGAIALNPADGPLPEQIIQRHGVLLDIAVDAVGSSASLADCLGSTAFGGRVCLVGMGSRQISVDAYRVSTEERSVVGSFCYSFDVFRAAAEWVASGEEIFGCLISAEVSLDHAQDAFQRLATKADVPGKILVRLDH
jgi:threonine dehydrogenase-like Zn-dependent dehydrogenase